MKKILLILLSLLLGIALYAGEKKESYTMFPKAKEGYVKYVVEVPDVKNPYDYKVELLIGKTMMVDCNHASLRAEITAKPLKGWGYTYLEVKNVQQGPTTMRMCNEPKVEKFISVYAPEITFRRYNSRLGTVIYVPRELEVRYRIWSADKTVQKALKQ